MSITTVGTNVPPIVWQSGQPVLPSEAAILAGVQADINTAFGGGVNPSLQTPQGQVAQSETAIIGDKNNEIAYIANQVNPMTASGAFQDAIGYIYFMTRIQASGTVVSCTCIGAVGTVIPAGSKAQDTAGYIYASTASATIPASGTVTIQFQNLTSGAIPCVPNTLNIIYAAVNGWDTVNNPAAGALGNAVESRSAFEARRQQSVAINAVNSVQSIQAAVLSVPNVLQAYTIDNPLNVPTVVGSTNYPMVANSVLVSVAGGSSAAIAQAIWSKKSLGCNYNGNTNVIVYDTSYSQPYPQYTVTFLIPTATNAFFNVQIKNNPQLPSGIIASVQNAIIAAFNGTDGGVPAYLNSTIYSSRYYAGISAISPVVDILSLGLGFTAPTANAVSLPFGIDQLPTISASNIVVTLV